jgi:hypothetical protein
MSEQKNRRRWLRWVAVIAIGIIVILGGVTFWWSRGMRVWTDERDIRIADRDAKLREILWNRPLAIEGPVNTAAHEYEPALSADGSELFFVRGKPGGTADIYVSHRHANAWSDPEPLDAINTPADELGPRLSADGRYLLFYSDREGGLGGYDIWAAQRSDDGWAEPFNLGPAINGPFNEYSPALTPDGKRLIFASNRAAASRVGSKEAWRATIREAELGDYDLLVSSISQNQPPAPTTQNAPATQTTTTQNARLAGAPQVPLSFAPATELQGANTPYHEGACDVSPGGDFIYFASNRPGGYGKFDLYRGRLRDNRVTDVENLGPPINTPDNEADPQLALGGFRLLFSSDRRGTTDTGYDLFTTDSREVFAARDARPLPRVGFSWWLLSLSILLLLPLIWMFRGIEHRKLTLIQRCILVSLLIHVLLGMFFGTVGVTQEVIQFVKGQGGGGGGNMQIAGNFDLGREIAIGESIRAPGSDLPSPGIPTASAALDIARTELPTAPTQAPAPTAVNVPQARVEQAPMTLPPAPPRNVSTAPPTVQSLAIAPPTATPATPNVAIQSAQAEVRPEAQPTAAPTPTVSGINPTRTDAPPHAPAAPVQIQPGAITLAPGTGTPGLGTSIIVAAPVGPSIGPIAMAGDPNLLRPQLTGAAAGGLPNVGTVPGAGLAAAATQPGAAEGSPQIAQANPALARQSTGAPTTKPSGVNLGAPTVAFVPDRITSTSAPAPIASPAGSATSMAGVSSPKAETVAITPGASAIAPDIAPPTLSTPLAGTSSTGTGERLANATLAPPTATPAAPPAIQPMQIGPANAAGIGARGSKTGPVTAANTAVAPVERQGAATGTLQPPGLAQSNLPPVATAGPGNGAGIGIGPTPGTSAIPLTGALGPVGPTAADALMRRAFEQRTPVIEDLGGTKESELAVARALAYLARNQEPDGRWTKYMRNRTPGSRDRHDTAYTALASLCFLGADHTPAKDSPYRQAVSRALEYLLSVQSADGDLRNGAGDMYDQGIAAIALGEAARMTKDPRYTRAALRACDFIVAAQNPAHGGWRYQPRADGDTSVLGWQVMALHGGEALGYQVPQRTREGALRWLERVSNGRHGGLAGYTNSNPRKSMTAEALFARILLSDDLTDPTIAEASKYLIEDSPASSPVDHYTWYYTSLALMQLQNDAWTKWNGQLRDHLVKLQRRNGELEGSWDMDANYGQRGGRVYSTALSTLTLEVYYRYLPMYSKSLLKDEKR